MNSLKISFHSIPATGTMFKSGIAVKSWKMQDHNAIIRQVIQNSDDTIFNKVRMERTVFKALELFDPKTIKIIQK